MTTKPESADDVGRCTLAIDMRRPPIEIGAQLGGAILPVVHVVTRQFDGLPCADVWHGLCAALFGAMAGQIGIDAADNILLAMRAYGERMRAENEMQAPQGDGVAKVH